MKMLDVDEALALCSDILGDIDLVPEEGEDFASSVEEKVTSMREWIEDAQRVTEPMSDALQNMRRGLDNWLRAPRRSRRASGSRSATRNGRAG